MTKIHPKEVILGAEATKHEAWTIKKNPSRKKTSVVEATSALMSTTLDNL